LACRLARGSLGPPWQFTDATSGHYHGKTIAVQMLIHPRNFDMARADPVSRVTDRIRRSGGDGQSQG
jgi:hypothetical protein